VPQEGIEPPTLALGVPCSILLSYWGLLESIIRSHRDAGTYPGRHWVVPSDGYRARSVRCQPLDWKTTYWSFR
jgi:hypothetical protein